MNIFKTYEENNLRYKPNNEAKSFYHMHTLNQYRIFEV